MNENAVVARQRNGLRKFNRMLAFAAILLILVSLLYAFEPFSEFWNNLLSNSATILSSGMCAVLATQTYAKYAPSDRPRRVWIQLAIGLWTWTFAETIWAYYNMTLGEVGITIADLLWVLAYGFFAYAVYIQYQIIFPGGRVEAVWIAIWVASTVVLTFLIGWLLVRFTGESWGLSLVLAAFYPAADIAIGLSAIRIVWWFRGGALSYPWIGLFSFSLADMLYAFLEFSGIYSWSVNQGNFLSAAADTTYVAAYLFVSIGCYAQLLLLTHGPIFALARKEIKT